MPGYNGNNYSTTVEHMHLCIEVGVAVVVRNPAEVASINDWLQHVAVDLMRESCRGYTFQKLVTLGGDVVDRVPSFVEIQPRGQGLSSTTFSFIALCIV